MKIIQKLFIWLVLEGQKNISSFFSLDTKFRKHAISYFSHFWTKLSYVEFFSCFKNFAFFTKFNVFLSYYAPSLFLRRPNQILHSPRFSRLGTWFQSVNALWKMHWSQIQEFQVGYARGQLEVKTEDDNLQEETNKIRFGVWKFMLVLLKNRLSASL